MEAEAGAESWRTMCEEDLHAEQAPMPDGFDKAEYILKKHQLAQRALS